MDRITFHHDTVLSDVHMLLPNARHLMTRLNGVGQPVFISRFRIMPDGERQDRKDPGKRLKEVQERNKSNEDVDKDTKVAHVKDEEEGGEGNEPFLDEDGDFDITRR
ncbi:methyltransferase-like protein 22 [Plectropomus leopardus]|nr:methyltransferase-like protein 22 [Plectropomus leopardus]